tara:strand:+ start:461 stop:718 length:258 start_codon:yes stop_codon:yes gene_type:complete
MIMMGEAPTPSEEYTKYSTVTGYFLQDDEATDPKGFDFVRYQLSRFCPGLILADNFEFWIKESTISSRCGFERQQQIDAMAALFT